MNIDVVSPHQDDAAFSIGLTLRALAQNQCCVRIVNVFTVSTFAPNAPALTLEQVCTIRAAEDAAFAAALGGNVVITNLGRHDAPIRCLAYRQGVRHAGPFAETDCVEIDTVTLALSRLWAQQGKPDLVLLPLAIGNHIDHRIALTAGVRASVDLDAGYFEDVPYVETESSIRARAHALAEYPRPELHAVLVGRGGSHECSRKRRLTHLYRSQLPRKVRRGIWRSICAFNGCERLWLPAAHVQSFEARQVPLQECARWRLP